MQVVLLVLGLMAAAGIVFLLWASRGRNGRTETLRAGEGTRHGRDAKIRDPPSR
jgi:hypothetical protein